jgi:hypothetical protein
MVVGGTVLVPQHGQWSLAHRRLTGGTDSWTLFECLGGEPRHARGSHAQEAQLLASPE